MSCNCDAAGERVCPPGAAPHPAPAGHIPAGEGGQAQDHQPPAPAQTDTNTVNCHYIPLYFPRI